VKDVPVDSKEGKQALDPAAADCDDKKTAFTSVPVP